MTIIIMQIAALVVIAWLLHGSASERTPQEIRARTRTDRIHKH